MALLSQLLARNCAVAGAQISCHAAVKLEIQPNVLHLSWVKLNLTLTSTLLEMAHRNWMSKMLLQDLPVER